MSKSQVHIFFYEICCCLFFLVLFYFFYFFLFLFSLISLFFSLVKVLETERRIYLVTEYASGGEIFGKYYSEILLCLS